MLEGLVQHDHPLTLQHVLGRMRSVHPGSEVVTLTKDGNGARHLRRGVRARRPARGRAEGARRRGGRPRGDVRVEHPAPPRGLPRDAVHRRRAAHAQPAPVRGAAHLHREPREGQARVRRLDRGAADGEGGRHVRDRRALRDHGRRRLGLAPERAPLRGAARRAAGGVRLPRRSTTAPPPASATRAARPATRRACSTRTSRRSCTRSGPAWPTRWGSWRPTACCRSCRCSTRTRGASLTPRG